MSGVFITTKASSTTWICKDYAGAAEVFARGSRVPNAHPFLAVLAAKMAEHAGDRQMARMMWSTTYQTTKDKTVRANAAAHLRALQVDEDVTNLEALSETLPTADWPFSVELFRTARLRTCCEALRSIPLDILTN